ncbi:MAG: hypothetical protein K5750_05945 [Eubacterium sp.]|nr:hypothetical protein [Eubacterium sp.]
MKTNDLKIRKKKFVAFVMIFALVLTLVPGRIFKKKIYAAGITYASDTYECYPTKASTVEHFTVKDDSEHGTTGKVINFEPAISDDPNWVEFNDGKAFVMDAWTILDVETDISISKIKLLDDYDKESAVIIKEGATLTLGEFEDHSAFAHDSIVEVYGKLVINEFDTQSMSDKAVIPSIFGTVEADKISLMQTLFNDDASAVYKAKTSFKKDDYDLFGTVVAEDDTIINSDGGKFTLQIGKRSVTVTDPVTDAVAADLLAAYDKDDPTIDEILVDGKTAAIADGDDVAAEEVEITISDINLSKIVTGDKTYTVGDGISLNSDSSAYTATLSFTAEEGSPKKISISAIDAADHSISLGFTLTHPRDLRKKITIKIDKPDDIYVGTDYDLTDKVNISDDKYDGKWSISYYKDAAVISKPDTSAPGTYSFKVNATETDNYFGAESDAVGFNIKYLDFPSSPFTITGTDNEMHAEDSITVIAPTGYKLRLGDGSYTDSISLTRDDLYTDDELRTDIYISLIRTGDNALTDKAGLLDAVPTIKKVIFDVEEEEEEEDEPEVIKNDSNISIYIEDQFYGVSYDPSVKTDSYGRVTVYYKNIDTNGDYTTEKPTAVGRYVAMAVAEETENNKEARAAIEFSIRYLPVLSLPYTISGDKGKNDFYTSKVSFVARDGYSISYTLGGGYSDSILYYDNLNAIYVRRDSDGAMSAAVRFDGSFKIDEMKPALSGSVKDQDGMDVNLSGDVYADKLIFTIADDHLKNVTVNGTEQKITDNKVVIELKAMGDGYEYVIEAEDLAGNTYKQSVNMISLWVNGGDVPAGQNVVLQGGKKYNLGSGKWKVNGDSTIYNGGSFYVKSAGEYTFDRID